MNTVVSHVVSSIDHTNHNFEVWTPAPNPAKKVANVSPIITTGLTGHGWSLSLPGHLASNPNPGSCKGMGLVLPSYVAEKAMS